MPQPTNNSLKDWLSTARGKLEAISDAPLLEAQMLASFVLSRPGSWLLAHSETSIDHLELELLNSNLKKLTEGFPLAYITGERQFYGRSFIIQHGILVPRPETELLVEKAIQWLKIHPSRQSVVDAGCGSGCIAVSLAAECQNISVTATDVNPQAVRLTNLNAVNHHVETRIQCLMGDLISPFQCKFDLICANLPYIPTETLKELAVTRHEPSLALDGGKDGLELIERLLFQATRRLASGGMILLEIEATQGESAKKLARNYFPRDEVWVVRDLANHPRLLVIQS